MNNFALIYRAFGSPSDCLRLESVPFCAPGAGQIRVAMSLAPINPSDLIPITGAYSNRITLPLVAGYEGVGRVVAAPQEHSHLLGQRVLPLCGAGTWQTHVDCDAILAVPVPEYIGDQVAARGYINPLAALTMLDTWPVKGKRVLLSGAGSTCADLLGHWARLQGAEEVVGIYRSENRVERMSALGITPVSIDDQSRVLSAARKADLTFDALGGPIASLILDTMRAGSVFIGYGLLTGQAVRPSRHPEADHKRFHLRHSIATMSAEVWQHRFTTIWNLLSETGLPDVQVFPFRSWQAALAETVRPGAAKPMLNFGSG